MATDTLLREVDYLLSLDPRVIGADQHVQELLRDLASVLRAREVLGAENERLRSDLRTIKWLHHSDNASYKDMFTEAQRIASRSLAAAPEGATEPCRCVYPDKCFCPPEAKGVTDGR